jgi:hypothetical protein
MSSAKTLPRNLDADTEENEGGDERQRTPTLLFTDVR